ncbi:MAG: hypothetical protein ACUVQY_03265 [Thermoproteota archaeon]
MGSSPSRFTVPSLSSSKFMIRVFVRINGDRCVKNCGGSGFDCKPCERCVEDPPGSPSSNANSTTVAFAPPALLWPVVLVSA